MTDKKKKAVESFSPRTEFALVWIVGTVIGWFVGMAVGVIFVIIFSLLIEGNVFPEESRVLSIYIMFTLASLCIGFAQEKALRECLNINIRSWWWLTALMWAVGLFVAINLGNAVFGEGVARPTWASSIFYMIVLGVPGITQTILLRRHLSQVWLYGFATLISGIIWGALLHQDSGEVWMLAPSISAIVTALVLLWLTSPVTARLSMRKEKAK